MLRKILLSVWMLVCAGGAGIAEGSLVEFEGRYWWADLDAKARAVESNLGADFDFKSDLGIGDENLPEGRLLFHLFGGHKLRFIYTQVQYEGSETVSRTIEFEGQSYTSGTRVNSDLELFYVRAGWLWEFLNVLKMVRLGTVVEAAGLFADATLEGPNLIPAIKESQEYVAVLPMGGLTLHVQPFKWVDVYGEASGFPAGSYGYFFDGEAGVKLTPIRYFTVKGGYRFMDIRAEKDPDFLKVQFSGPFVGGVFEF